MVPINTQTHRFSTAPQFSASKYNGPSEAAMPSKPSHVVSDAAVTARIRLCASPRSRWVSTVIVYVDG